MSSKSFSRQADSVCSDYDFLFKILILGNSGVGKSSLLLRYSDDTFTDVFIATIGVDFKIRTVEMEGKKLKLQMWDTAGQDRFRSVISSFYRKVDGVVVVYDVTDMNSFLGVETWLKDVDKFGRETACKILVGNKADLKSKKVVDFETGKALADKLGISFLETSAKQNTNVEQCFLSMAADLKATADKDALALPEREEPVRLGDGKTMFTSLPCWCK